MPPSSLLLLSSSGSYPMLCGFLMGDSIDDFTCAVILKFARGFKLIPHLVIRRWLLRRCVTCAARLEEGLLIDGRKWRRRTLHRFQHRVVHVFLCCVVVLGVTAVCRWPEVGREGVWSGVGRCGAEGGRAMDVEGWPACCGRWVPLNLRARPFAVAVHRHVHRHVDAHAWVVARARRTRVVVSVRRVAVLCLTLVTGVVVGVRWRGKQDLRVVNGVREPVRWCAIVVCRLKRLTGMRLHAGLEHRVLEWQQNVGDILRGPFGPRIARGTAGREGEQAGQGLHFKRWQAGEWTHLVVPVTRMRSNGLCETAKETKKSNHINDEKSISFWWMLKGNEQKADEWRPADLQWRERGEKKILGTRKRDAECKPSLMQKCFQVTGYNQKLVFVHKCRSGSALKGDLGIFSRTSQLCCNAVRIELLLNIFWGNFFHFSSKKMFESYNENGASLRIHFIGSLSNNF